VLGKGTISQSVVNLVTEVVNEENPAKAKCRASQRKKSHSTSNVTEGDFVRLLPGEFIQHKADMVRYSWNVAQLRFYELGGILLGEAA
jgi:hypothetical protein